MSLVQLILSHLPGVHKPQLKFLLLMFGAFFAFRGKANRTNLSRYGAPDPRTQYRWQQRPFDFIGFNLAAIEEEGVTEHPLAAVMDASFINKSGKRTHGLGWFYNGCHSRAERGLEVSALGLVDLKENTAYTIDVRQTPADLPGDETRLNFYLRQLKEVHPRLPPSVKLLLVDGAFANAPFVTGACTLGLHVVSKLRKDAALRHLYNGPRRPGPGRPRIYDGKVSFEDTSRWELLGTDDNGIEFHTLVAWHDTIKRKLRVVRLSRTVDGKCRHVLLFSTDTTLTGWQIVEMYRARFQIEFVFRDGKQFCGLKDGQMRDEAALRFHFNMSLAALNILRLQERALGRNVISLASVKRRQYNILLLNQIIDRLGLDPDLPEIRSHVEELREYGVIAA